MKVIFTYYPLQVRYNHGIALLVALCRAAGVRSYIIPMDNLQEFQRKVDRIRPDYICVSYVCEHDYYAAMPFIEAVKSGSLESGAPDLIAGGVYCRKGAYINPGLFDFICRGDGELLPDFFTHGDTKVFDEKCYCEDISALPLPDYGTVTGFEFARGHDFLKRIKIIPYSSSRGCPYKCSFCETRYQPESLRIRKTVKQDLETLYERHTPDLFYFLDEMLPYYNEEWREQIEGNNYPFMCYIRADIKADDLRFLHANGLRVCAFGVESGDEKYRNRTLKKSLLDIDIWSTVGLLKELNIQYIPFFMTNTPYETTEIKTKTLEMFNKIGGHPTMWEYEDMGKKVFDISDRTAEVYCKKIDVSEEIFKAQFDDPKIHIVSNNGSFLMYSVEQDCIYAADVWGDGDWIFKYLQDLCQQYNKLNIRGFVREHEKGFHKKYGFETLGHVINFTCKSVAEV